MITYIGLIIILVVLLFMAKRLQLVHGVVLPIEKIPQIIKEVPVAPVPVVIKQDPVDLLNIARAVGKELGKELSAELAKELRRGIVMSHKTISAEAPVSTIEIDESIIDVSSAKAISNFTKGYDTIADEEITQDATTADKAKLRKLLKKE